MTKTATKPRSKAAKPSAKNREKKTDRNRRFTSEILAEVNIISASEAKEMGYTPGQLRVIANSLERIAKGNGQVNLTYTKNKFGDTVDTTLYEVNNFDRQKNFVVAREFRTLAKMLEMLERTS